MKFVLPIVLVFTFSLNSFGQLEKVGVYSGLYANIADYNLFKNKPRKDIFFEKSLRLGLMTSHYVNRRFSFESGLFFDSYSMEKSLRIDHSLPIFLKNHDIINAGIPLGFSMRTNLTRNCVTYLKATANSIFSLYESQNYESQKYDVSNTDIEKYTSFVPRFYGADIDFGFGTFWHIKNYNIQLCLEPKATIVSYRNGQTHLSSDQIVLYHSGFQFFSRLGFEITLYKDIF